MKIYFLAYNIFGMGGTVRTVANTANFFASEGYDVEIISIKKTSKKPMFELNEKIKINHVFDSRRGMLFGKNTPLYKKVIKKALLKIPSLLIHRDEDLYKNFNFFIDLKLLLKLKEIKKGYLITTIPSFNILASKIKSKSIIKIGQEHKVFDSHSESLKRKIKKSYYKLDALTCLTDSAAQDYKEIFHDKLDIYKIENATHVPDKIAKLENKTVMAAGRYVEDKGFDLLIEAFSDVAKKHPEWKLKIFGDGEQKERLQKLIFEKEAYNNIYLMPKSNKIIEEMLNSSIYALSSRYESFGMVVIESMSVGLPTVCFASEGPKEIIKNNIDGILVEEGNIEDFSNALSKLIESEELRKKIGKSAKENVNRYTFKAIGRKWENLLDEQKMKQKGNKR